MKKLSNAQLIKEVRALRTTLAPIINLEFKELLIEVERRLSGGEPGEAGSIKSKKPKQGERITKKKAYEKFLNK